MVQINLDNNALLTSIYFPREINNVRKLDKEVALLDTGATITTLRQSTFEKHLDESCVLSCQGVFQ